MNDDILVTSDEWVGIVPLRRKHGELGVLLMCLGTGTVAVLCLGTSCLSLGSSSPWVFSPVPYHPVSVSECRTFSSVCSLFALELLGCICDSLLITSWNTRERLDPFYTNQNKGCLLIISGSLLLPTSSRSALLHMAQVTPLDLCHLMKTSS